MQSARIRLPQRLLLLRPRGCWSRLGSGALGPALKMDPSPGGERGISNSSEKGRERGRSEVPALLGSASEGTD